LTYSVVIIATATTV